jgi:uncharacterized protein YkwD
MKYLSLFALGCIMSFEPLPSAVPCLSDEEAKLHELINTYRKGRGLSAIPVSAKLTRVAHLHARDLEENYNPENKKCNLHSWSKKGNWTPCCYTDDHAEAECMWSKPKEIARYPGNGYEISFFNSAGATAEEGLNGWKQSKGHHEVIINQGIWRNVTWNAVGIGIYGNYGVVWFGEAPDEEPCR